jgi:hypothetical protein
MISLLVYILVIILIFGVIFYALRLIPIEQPFLNIAYLILLVVFILVLLSIIGIIPGVAIRPLT